MEKKETQLTWKKVNSKKIDLGNGNNFIGSLEDLYNEDTNGTTRFIIFKKWKTDGDGVSYKKPTKFFLAQNQWPEVKKLIDSLDLPN